MGTLASMVPGDTVTRLASLPGVGTASGVAALAGGDPTGKLLPVLSELAEVLPFGGLRRGSTVSVRGSTSLLLALLAEATARGSWAAVVGMPHLGVAAAAELGVEVSRLALVPAPGADLVPVVAALLDGVDVVVVGCGVPDRLGVRRLSARARHRGAVLIAEDTWPGADVELRCEPGGWQGLGGGPGYLRERQVTVHGTGRGSAARPVRTTLLLPGSGGRVAPAELGAVEPRVALEVG